MVLTPAGAPALQKAEIHCGAGAPAGLESRRVGRPSYPVAEFCKRLSLSYELPHKKSLGAPEEIALELRAES